MDQKKASLEMGKRLKELREEKGLSHEKLRNAIKEKYGIDISKDSLINYETSVETHSKAYKNNGMKVEYLRCFADFYGVSSDYLLGLSNVPSRDPDVQKVCKYTGLSKPAAIRLHELAKEEDEKGNDIISFLFQFLHNLLVFENLTSFRDNALLSVLSDITHKKALYHSREAFEASEAPHDTEAEKKRLIDEINGEKTPCGTIEVSAETAAAIYRKRAKASLDSAFDDALMFTQQSIEEKYYIDEYRSQQIKLRWSEEE